MARTPKLKVFRTPIGFHDAYVAAPSQKAALEAWGSESNLFARGEAEVVSDPALTAEPLASPGVVIKRLRGTAAEQIAALPPNKDRAAKKSAKDRLAPKSSKGTAKAAAKPAPRPSREALHLAEQALAAAEDQQRRRFKELTDRQAALARERRELEKAHEKEAGRLTRERDKAAAAYEKAMQRWREE